MHHVFCLGGNVCKKLSENVSATFLTFLRTRILKINFCKYSIYSVYIVKSLSFFHCEAIFIIFPRKLIVNSLPPTPLLSSLLQIGFTDPVFTSLYFIDCCPFVISIPRWLPTKRCDASNFKYGATLCPAARQLKFKF